jgi:hypothetical protein
LKNFINNFIFITFRAILLIASIIKSIMFKNLFGKLKSEKSLVSKHKEEKQKTEDIISGDDDKETSQVYPDLK